MLATLQGWSDTLEENKNCVRNVVYSLIPTWKNKEIYVVPTKTDIIVISTDESFVKDKICIVYTDGCFVVKRESANKFIPVARELYKTFSLITMYGNAVIISFHFYTGIYCVTFDNTRTELRKTMFFETKEDYLNAIKYCETTLTSVDNNVGANSISLVLNSVKDDARILEWYRGKWPEMIEKGINGDEEYDERLEHITRIHSKYISSPYDGFIENLNNSKIDEVVFNCDNCKETVGYYYHFYHCPICIKEEDFSYDICFKCMEEKTFTHQHYMIDPRNEEIISAYSQKYHNDI
jgi:hypothetical protein